MGGTAWDPRVAPWGPMGPWGLALGLGYPGFGGPMGPYGAMGPWGQGPRARILYTQVNKNSKYVYIYIERECYVYVFALIL